MATTSTVSYLDQIRTRLLSFTSNALSTALGARLWIDAAPDTAGFPYGIMRVVDNSQSTEYDANRYVVQLELMIYGNKRSQAAAVEDAADLADKSMIDYVDATSGITWCRARTRATTPASEDPAFRENVSVRLVYELVVYPLYLNT